MDFRKVSRESAGEGRSNHAANTYLARVGLAAILTLGSAVIAGCDGGTEPLAKPVCRDAQITMGIGTSTALGRTMQAQAMIINPDQYAGYHEAYEAARVALQQLHDGGAVQPGDSFRWCNDNTRVWYEDGSAQLAEAN